MTRAINVTEDPVLERHARAVYYKISHHQAASIGEIKGFELNRGLDPFSSSTDWANLLTVISLYVAERVIEPVLDSDRDRNTWRGFVSGELDDERLLDPIKLRFRRAQRDRYSKNQIAFLRVLDR